MELYLIPSITAICFKIAIFLRYQDSLRRENFNLCVLFLAAFMLNLVELISFERTYSHDTSLLILIAYYCCAVFIVHGYLNIAIEYSKLTWHKKAIQLGLNVLLAIVTLALIFDRGVIADYELGMGGYALTKIEGSRYWIFQIYALGGMAAALGLLISGARKLDSNLQRRQCLVFLLSSLAPVLITTGVILLQAQGFPVSAGIFMSLAFTVMLAIIVYAEEKSRLFRLLTMVPFSSERKLHSKLLQQITECVAINDSPDSESNLNLKQMMKSLEGSVVEHVLQYYGGNQKLAASALGVSEATISRRARAVLQPSSPQTAERNTSIKPSTTLAEECLQQSSVRITE